MTLLITRDDRKNVESHWAVAEDDCRSPERGWSMDKRSELVEVIGKIKWFYVYNPVN